MKDAVLAVDIGTTSLKAGVFTVSGEVVSVSVARAGSQARKFYAKDWMFALREAISSLYYFNCNLCGICVSGNGPTVVSGDGTTLLWNEEISDFNFSRDGDAAKSLFIPRIVHFEKIFPDSFKKSKYIYSGPEFFIYQLTGKSFTVLPEKRFEVAYWTGAVLAEADIPSDKMPPYIGIGEKCGELKDSVAYFLNLPAGIPVFGGGPDFVAALIGTNTMAPGKICDRCGSSEGFNCCIDKPIFSKDVRTLPSVVPGYWNISCLIPKSSRLSVDLKVQKAKESVSIIRQLLKENNLVLDEIMTVSGGQARDRELIKQKALATGQKIAVCNRCFDAELIGDLCAALKGLGIYNSLWEAASEIVKEKVIY